MNILVQVGDVVVVHPTNKRGIFFGDREYSKGRMHIFYVSCCGGNNSVNLLLQIQTTLFHAVPYSCTDIPTPAKNELGESCADFNLDPHFKFEITRGFGA